jgi:signal transduction histidine kinase
MNNQEARYGGVAMFYHWVMAVLVVIVGTLGQAIGNLLHNAAKYAEGDGQIDLDVSQIGAEGRHCGTRQRLWNGPRAAASRV